MKRTVVGVFSPDQVALLLASHLCEQREIDLVHGSTMKAELLAVFANDGHGLPGISQFRVEAVVEEARESWKD